MKTNTLQNIGAGSKELAVINNCRCGRTCPPKKDIKPEPLLLTKTPAEFFEAAMDAPRALIVLRQQIAPSKEEVRRLALVLGGVQNTRAFGEVRSIKYDPDAKKSTALSLREHKPHTDGSFMPTPPARFILSFAQSDPGGGGVSTFIPLSTILAAAPESVLASLYTAECRFARDDDGGFTDAYVGTILSRDERGCPRLRWRYDENVRPAVVNSHGTDAEAAIDWLHEFLLNNEPIKYAAKTGETVLIPNATMLHGRTPLSPDSAREVFRAWIA